MRNLASTFRDQTIGLSRIFPQNDRFHRVTQGLCVTRVNATGLALFRWNSRLHGLDDDLAGRRSCRGAAYRLVGRFSSAEIHPDGQ
jgi:hypothetical protein